MAALTIACLNLMPFSSLPSAFNALLPLAPTSRLYWLEQTFSWPAFIMSITSSPESVTGYYHLPRPYNNRSIQAPVLLHAHTFLCRYSWRCLFWQASTQVGLHNRYSASFTGSRNRIQPWLKARLSLLNKSLKRRVMEIDIEAIGEQELYFPQLVLITAGNCRITGTPSSSPVISILFSARYWLLFSIWGNTSFLTIFSGRFQ